MTRFGAASKSFRSAGSFAEYLRKEYKATSWIPIRMVSYVPDDAIFLVTNHIIEGAHAAIALQVTHDCADGKVSIKGHPNPGKEHPDYFKNTPRGN